MQPNIAMNFAEYVFWILLCMQWLYGEKIYYQSRDIEFFPRGSFFSVPCRRVQKLRLCI